MPHTMHMPPPDVEYEGKVRAHDPDTSWDAAGEQTVTKTQILRKELRWLLLHKGPMTDDQLVKARKAMVKANPDEHHRATPQSVRSRRSELVTKGWVVWTGEKRDSDNGGPSNVWRARADNELPGFER